MVYKHTFNIETRDFARDIAPTAGSLVDANFAKTITAVSEEDILVGSGVVEASFTGTVPESEQKQWSGVMGYVKNGVAGSVSGDFRGVALAEGAELFVKEDSQAYIKAGSVFKILKKGRVYVKATGDFAGQEASTAVHLFKEEGSSEESVGTFSTASDGTNTVNITSANGSSRLRVPNGDFNNLKILDLDLTI